MCQAWECSLELQWSTYRAVERAARGLFGLSERTTAAVSVVDDQYESHSDGKKRWLRLDHVCRGEAPRARVVQEAYRRRPKACICLGCAVLQDMTLGSVLQVVATG